MQKLAKITSIISSIALLFSLAAVPFKAAAAELPPVIGTSGSWVVANLASDGDDWKIEAFKNDRDLVVWSEINQSLGQRRLMAYDGVSTRQIAFMRVDDWNDAADAAFFDPVRGSFDVADGLAVWVQSDGTDREIYSFDGSQVRQVSNNTYDDKHPVTSRGQIAWTSVPGSSYNLMLKDRAGVHRLDGYQVLNYVFSGPNLFWLNRRANENWFRVFRYDGSVTAPVGIGDDRPISQYFVTDGQGSAAWEFSTKNWDYDKRSIFLSDAGAEARQIVQRDVPPNLLRVEAVKGSEVLFNTTDMLTSLLYDSTLLRGNGFSMTSIARKITMSRARFVDGGIIRHMVPETSSALLLDGDKGGEDYVSLDHVILNLFESDGSNAAGALLKGGLLTYFNGKAETIPTSADVRILAVNGGNIAWIEGGSGKGILKSAFRPVLVRSSVGAKFVSGHLVKEPGKADVYLAAVDGKRYLIPGEGQFYGWYGDFHSVRTVPSASLSALPLGGNVLYRPGYRLLKTAASPRVYTVGANGQLHWVTSADVLVQLYGSDWNRTRLDVIPETLLSDYSFGLSVDDPSRFYIALR